MNKKLQAKVAVVTGASKGIGAQIARRFACEGARVVVNYSRSKDDAAKVVEAFSATLRNETWMFDAGARSQEEKPKN